MIKKVIFLWSIGILVVVFTGCNRLEMLSQWSENTISVDGDPSDWEKGALNELEEMSVTLGLCNDSEYLYLMLGAENPIMTENLRRAGLSLWLSSADVNEPQLGIFFSGSDSLRPGPDPNDSFWESMTPDQKSRFGRRQWEMRNRIGIRQGDKSFHIPPHGSEGISAALTFRPGMAVYEFEIPIRRNELWSYSLDFLPGETIHLRIKLGDMEMEALPTMDPSRYSGRGMMGGGRMGDRGTGMRPGMGAPLKTEVWIDVVLAGRL